MGIYPLPSGPARATLNFTTLTMSVLLVSGRLVLQLFSVLQIRFLCIWVGEGRKHISIVLGGGGKKAYLNSCSQV
jgi:hypothetical protein